MHNILNLIVETKKKKIEVLKKSREGLLSLIKSVPAAVSFKDALRRQGCISIIGEIKRASPSAGLLVKDFSPLEIARVYKNCKVSALSIVTEEEFFLGRAGYIEDVKKEIELPVLRKDFILDEVQILESRAIGADAVLLIMRILEEERFERLYKTTKDLGMEVLVEVHTEKELRRVLKHGADIVGINNRNLNTLKVDLAVTQKLIPFIPEKVVKVSESGVNSFKDMLWLKGLGVDAVLVGESIMRAGNREEKIKEINIDA